MVATTIVPHSIMPPLDKPNCFQLKSIARAQKRTEKKKIDVEAQERVAKGLKPQVVEVSVRGGLMALVKEKLYGMTQ
jgi:hypothetical protein